MIWPTQVVVHLVGLVILFHSFKCYAQKVSFSELVRSREEAITAVANKVGAALSTKEWCSSSDSCNKTDTCVYHGCSGTFGDDAACKPGLFLESCADRLVPGFQNSSVCNFNDPKGTLLNLKRPSFRTPEGATSSEGDDKPITVSNTLLLRDICALKGVQDTIVNAFEEANLSTWLYVGTVNKAYVIYPGVAQCRTDEASNKFEACGYDPTTRPWYITAASGPRDIVFLFDLTSLATEDSILREAFKKILASTDRRDRIAIVTVKIDDASVLAPSDSDLLSSPNSSFIASISASLDNLGDVGDSPNMTMGFELAFEILSRSESSSASTNCTKYIVAMMGKADVCFSSSCSNTNSCTCVESLAANIEKWQKNLAQNATIVTFTESKDTDVRRVNNLEKMARSIVCSRSASGSWRRVTDGDTADTAMSSFVQLAAQSLYEEDSKVFSSDVYSDASGLGDMFTFAVPIYDRNIRQLLAVAGLDVTVAEVMENTGVSEPEAVSEIISYSASYRGCPTPKDRDSCALQAVRGQPGSAICADFLPVGDNTTDCFVFGDDIYVRVDEPLTFDDALEYCQTNFYNATLAIADNSVKNSYLGGLYSYDGSWIGLRALDNDSLAWVNNSTKSTFQFLYNYTEVVRDVKAEANTGVCVTADRRGVTENWNIESCNVLRPFICQFGMNNVNAKSVCNYTYMEIEQDQENINDSINPQGCSELYEPLRGCSDEEDAKLNGTQPFCPQNGSSFNESDRFCCGGRADPMTWHRSGTKRLSTGALIGIAIGAVVAFGLVLILIFVFVKRWRRTEPGTVENSNDIGAAKVTPKPDHIGRSPTVPGRSYSTMAEDGGRRFEDREGAKLARLSLEDPVPSESVQGTESSTARPLTESSEAIFDKFL